MKEVRVIWKKKERKKKNKKNKKTKKKVIFKSTRKLHLLGFKQ